MCSVRESGKRHTFEECACSATQDDHWGLRHLCVLDCGDGVGHARPRSHARDTQPREARVGVGREDRVGLVPHIDNLRFGVCEWVGGWVDMCARVRGCGHPGGFEWKGGVVGL